MTSGVKGRFTSVDHRPRDANTPIHTILKMRFVSGSHSQRLVQPVSSRKGVCQSICSERRTNVGGVGRPAYNFSRRCRAEALNTERSDENTLGTSQQKQTRRSIEDLQNEMKQLQEQIHEAHFQAHLQEARLAEALSNVEALGEKAITFDNILDPATQSEAASSSLNEKKKKKKNHHLRSDLTWPAELMDYWYPVEFSKNIKADQSIAFDIFNVPLVLSRDASTGKVACSHDASSSLQNPYLDLDGSISRNRKEEGYPTKEKDGFVWVWVSEKEAPMEEDAVPGFTVPPNAFHEDQDFVIHAELVIDVEVEHGLLLENLLDLAHAPFTHTSTFAKGWSIPDLVKFNTSKLLGGNWEPYPIDMSFEPPCMVLSTIGLMQPGKLEEGARAAQCANHLHQLHVCLPSSKGTRLLYRMSLDFMGFMLYVPFAKKIWETMAAQVLGEDLVLVQGQQDRLLRGGDTWNNPVPYDKLAVRYRKWRNSLPDKELRAEAEAALKTMSAGEMLSPEEQEIS